MAGSKILTICFNINKHSFIHLRNPNLNCNLRNHVKSPKFNTLLNILQMRQYALMLYAQQTPEKKSTVYKVHEYLKEKNDLVNIFQHNTATSPNTFNQGTAAKQLYSLVFHSLQPSPEEVMKLFHTYTSLGRSSLHQIFYDNNSNAVFMIRIESSIRAMSLNQLYQFSVDLAKLRSFRLKFINHLARSTFEESLSRAELTNSIENAYKYFLIGMELYGNNISSKIGFKEFLSVLGSLSEKATPMKQSHLLYFIGLSKQNLQEFSVPNTALKSLMKDSNFNTISFIDAGLAISGLFKLNIKCEKESPLLHNISEKIIERIKPECSPVLNALESFAFISMVKYLRFSMYKDNVLLKSVKQFLLRMDEVSYNPQFVCHIIAFFANSNFYDQEVYSLLCNKVYDYLKSTDQVMRIKDLSRVMWSLSHAQHQCSSSFLSLVIEILEKFILTGDLALHPTHVVDSTLALCTLKVYPEKLLSSVLNPTVFQSIKEKDKSRYLSRLLVLSEVQKAFLPSLALPIPDVPLEKLPQRSISDECYHRPYLRLIRSGVEWLKESCGTPVFHLRFLVPHIHYCSVVPSGKTSDDVNIKSDVGLRVLRNLSQSGNLKVAVDINDSNNLMTGDERVIGMEVLKRDILKKKGWTVQVLSSKEVEACGEDIEAIAALLVQTVVNSK